MLDCQEQYWSSRCPRQTIELYSEEVEGFAQKFKQILGRLEIVQAPINDHEIPLVIKKQLFANEAEEEIVRSMVSSFRKLYERLSDVIPFPRLRPDYFETMKRSYPFHPTLLELFVHNWSTIPSFQGIRGTLRVLSLVIHDLWKEKRECPLILAGDVNLCNDIIQKEILKHLDSRWGVVLRKEISDVNSRAKIVDEELGERLQEHQLARRLATSIFLSSITTWEDDRGKTSGEIMLMNLTPLEEMILLDDILDKLEKRSWYLHHVNQKYFYTTDPNLNYYLALREENMDFQDIKNEIRKFLNSLKKTKPKTIVWPSRPSLVPDKPEIQVIILPLSHPHGDHETVLFTKELYDKAGKNGIRLRKNMLIVVAADSSHLSTLFDLVRRYLALKRELSDQARPKSASETKKMTEELSELEKIIPFKLLMTYRHVGVAGRDEVYWLEMDLPKSSDHLYLTERIIDFLKKQQLIVDRLTPLYLVDRAFGQQVTEKTFQELWTLFLSTPGFPILEHESVLIESIIQGVNEHLFTIKGVNISKGHLTKKSLTPETVIVVSGTVDSSHSSQQSVSLSRGHPEDQKDREDDVKSLRIQVEMTKPEASWHDFYRGVILPLLKNPEQSKLQISLTIEWSSSLGISKDTFENQIKESLQQLPIKVKHLEHSERE